MMTFLTTYALPILQSIIASRIDTAMDRWAKAEDTASDEGRFCQIMKQAFIRAVNKVKGCSPMVVKDNVDELFDECRDAVVAELRTMKPAQVKAYVGTELFEAFKVELENTDEAIPYINETVLKSIQQQANSFDDKLNELCATVSEIQKVTDSIRSITESLMGEKAFSACRIVPHSPDMSVLLPPLCSMRQSLISEMEAMLKENKSLVLYAGVKEGKTVASMLLASRFQTDYHIIEIDLAYRNELNLEYVITSCNKSGRCLFILDGVKYDSDMYDAFCAMITGYADDDHLFVINCYDKISDYVSSDNLSLAEKELPPLTIDDVKEMMQPTCDPSLAYIVRNLCQGHPFLANALCSFLKTKQWTLTDEEVKRLFTFSHTDPLKKKVRQLLRTTVKDRNAYNLLNRLMVITGSFSEKECARLAGFNPILSNPKLLLDSLVGMWVMADGGKYRLSCLLSKAMDPDLLPQEEKDCYNYEAGRYLQKQKLTPYDALAVLNCFIRAEELDKAGAFYVMMLMKLRDAQMLDADGISLIKAVWVGVSLPPLMSVTMKMVVRCVQLTILQDMKEQYADSIIDEILSLLDEGGIDRKLSDALTQVAAACCILYGNSKKAIVFQQRCLALPNSDLPFSTKDITLVSLSKVSTCDDFHSWLPLYANLNFPHDRIFSEGSLMAINNIYDAADECDREKVLRDIFNHSLSCRADIFAAASAAKLIEYYWREGKEADAINVMKDAATLLYSYLGEILLNYSFGLGLLNHGLSAEAYPYLEKAARSKHIESACMVSLNARCTYAQILGDKGDKAGAVDIIRELVEHPCFDRLYSTWEQHAALCTLSYALWENGQRKEAVAVMLKVEHYLWSVRNNEDADYVNLSVRFVVLVLYVQSQSIGKTVDERFATPDYSLFIKSSASIDQVYKPERNFMKEELLYELAERYADEDAALTVIEHMMNFQREDAAAYARLLSAMVQAIPLCLAKGRRDIIEYILTTVLSAPHEPGEESHVNYEILILNGYMLQTVAYRAKCLINGQNFDEEWFFDMIEKSSSLSQTSTDIELMVAQMLSSTPNYNDMKDILQQEIVYLYHFQREDFSRQLSLLWKIGQSLDAFANMPSAQRFVHAFVLDYVRNLIKENPEKFSCSLAQAESLFHKVASLYRIEYTKKIIQGLYFHLSVEVEVTEDMQQFLYDP